MGLGEGGEGKTDKGDVRVQVPVYMYNSLFKYNLLRISMSIRQRRFKKRGVDTVCRGEMN